MPTVSNPKKLKGLILAALFPQRCIFCRAVIPSGSDYCDKCAKMLPEIYYVKHAVGGAGCCSPFLYKDGYAAAVKRMKYGGKKNYARPLALFAAGAAAREYDLSSFDFVTCVPMHKSSLGKRHFNQAEELAKEFCAFTGLIYLDTLEKYKQNKPQHSMHRSARASNVKGVFRVLDKQAVRGRKILLVDDIITTGNTLGECARLLKKAGCAEVSCVTVCSTII